MNNTQWTNAAKSGQGQRTGSTGEQSSLVTMSDRDYLTDILSTEKYLTDGMNAAVREASNDQLFRVEFGILQETHENARKAYNLMLRKGWYKVESAAAQKIGQTVQKSSQNANQQFPFH